MSTAALLRILQVSDTQVVASARGLSEAAWCHQRSWNPALS